MFLVNAVNNILKIRGDRSALLEARAEVQDILYKYNEQCSNVEVRAEKNYYIMMLYLMSIVLKVPAEDECAPWWTVIQIVGIHAQ